MWGSFDFDKHDRGPGLWSLNNSILKDRTYTKLIKYFLEEWKTVNNKYKDILFWWDLGKKKIKNLTINYCKEQCRTERTYIYNFKRDKIQLRQLDERGLLADQWELVRVQNKLIDYVNIDIEAKITAKVDEIEQGERYTSYFVKLERQKAKHKMMTTLIKHNETVINKQDDILNETAEFFKRLYPSEKTDNSS